MALYVIDSTDVNPNGMEEVTGSIPVRSTNQTNNLDGYGSRTLDSGYLLFGRTPVQPQPPRYRSRRFNAVRHKPHRFSKLDSAHIPTQASIGPSFSGATFIQLWRMHSVEEQLGLLYSGNHDDLFRTASDTARRAQILGPRRWALAFGMQTELTECLSGLLSPTESETSRMAMLSPVTI